MTINVALATYDSIVLGCDSLSSVVLRAIFPFLYGADFALDAGGQPLVDQDGNNVVAVRPDTMKNVALNVFGGVNKMFCLYEDKNKDTCVAAMTSGLAILDGATIAEQAKRFRRHNESIGVTFASVLEVVNAFTAFIRAIWEKDEGTKPEQFRETVNFIIAGYGKDDVHARVYRCDIKDSTSVEQFNDAPHCGLCWAGQADYVERLVQGVDSVLKTSVSRELAKAMEEQRRTTLTDISDALARNKVELPGDFDVTITEHQPATLPWSQFQADIDFGNLSTQYGIHLVEMLVNTQSGMQRFTRGIATVGGRTHIGVLKLGEGFSFLNAPQLEHKHTGYANE